MDLLRPTSLMSYIGSLIYPADVVFAQQSASLLAVAVPSYRTFDFTKTFDLVNRPILLTKLARLDLPQRAVNWIISYLTGQSRVLKYDVETSSIGSAAEINTSIAQGSGLGPMLYVFMESDLCTMSAMNVLVKYADDTNLVQVSK